MTLDGTTGSRRLKASSMNYTMALGGAWLDVVYDSLDARIDLLSVDLRIRMADLYRGIEPRKLRIRA